VGVCLICIYLPCNTLGIDYFGLAIEGLRSSDPLAWIENSNRNNCSFIYPQDN